MRPPLLQRSAASSACLYEPLTGCLGAFESRRLGANFKGISVPNRRPTRKEFATGIRIFVPDISTKL